ncbi:MAG: GDSL-type esterase/lipase family protein, partial [Pirellulales bacterium]
VGPATSTINSVGVRGAEIPANEATLRILCVGGTSTESPYLDDAECWPTLLARDLTKQLGRDVWVGSVGFGSYGLDEHREFLANSDLIDQVDCIVVMPGMNDFLSSVLGLGEPEGGPLWSQLHSLDVAREVWNGRLGNGCVCDPQGETWTMFRLGQPIPEISVDDAVAVKSFHKKLEQLVLAAQARDKPLVLVTQAVLWKRFLSEPGERRLLYARQYPLPRDWELLAPGSLATLFTQFNEQIHEVVNQNPHVGLIDVAAILDGNERAFYDDYHFNEYGSQECAAIISNWFAASRRRHSP